MKVFVAIPNMGVLVPDLVSNLLYWAKQTKIPCDFFLPEGIQPLDVARNSVVDAFLKTDCSHIWWIDSDVVPPRDALYRLSAHKLDIVSACCFCMRAANGKYFPYPTTFKKHEWEHSVEYTICHGQGLQEVDAVGGGCVLVSRGVYVALGNRPYEFLYHPSGQLVLTCDFNVWHKAQEIGFAVHVDYSILCDHQRKCSIKGFQDLLVGSVNGR